MKETLDTPGKCFARMRLLQEVFYDEDKAKEVVAGIRAAVKGKVVTWKKLGFKNQKEASEEFAELLRQAKIKDIRRSLDLLRDLLKDCSLNFELVDWAVNEWIRPVIAEGTVSWEDIGYESEAEANKEFDWMIEQSRKPSEDDDE